MSVETGFPPAAAGEALQSTPQNAPAAKRPWVRPTCRQVLWVHETANSNTSGSDGIFFS